MWIFTTIGFFSVVQKDGDRHLTVRARVRDDLVNLRQICPSLSRPIHTPHADYSWRSTVSHQEWSQALAQLGKEIDYHNFKSEVERRQGKIRAGLYSRVWAMLLELAGLDVRRKP